MKETDEKMKDIKPNTSSSLAPDRTVPDQSAINEYVEKITNAFNHCRKI